MTVTPSPDTQGVTALPTDGQEAKPVTLDANAKGSKNNPYLLDEVFTFNTEVLANGSPRTNAADATYDTVGISISLNNFLTPDYFASKYSDKYKLTGTEAGAEITFTVESSTGASSIMPQNAIDIAFENEAGDENEGYQIMDAEISGLYDITVQVGQTVQVYKRFAYEAAENMQYMVVRYYQGGQEYKAYFRLEVAEPEIVYDEISSGSRGDNVQALQERLIELGYLDDDADGIFGPNTEAAVRAAHGLDEASLHQVVLDAARERVGYVLVLGDVGHGYVGFAALVGGPENAAGVIAASRDIHKVYSSVPFSRSSR